MRKAVLETIRQLEIMELEDKGDAVVLNDAISLLNGYMRILIVLSQFRITLTTFIGHYPELFGE